MSSACLQTHPATGSTRAAAGHLARRSACFPKSAPSENGGERRHSIHGPLLRLRQNAVAGAALLPDLRRHAAKSAAGFVPGARKPCRRWRGSAASPEAQRCLLSAHWRRGGPHPDVTDCAALIRFAYREALRAHDGEWASALRLPLVPALPSVRKYEYPYTPAGAALFRVRDGVYRSPAELAEFADAKTLGRLNTRFVSRDIGAAVRGDILFFRQERQSLPFHAMVFTGASHFERGGGPWIVYHTGPAGGEPGGMRRVTVAELQNHREPRWRPLPFNSNFLGVYRWNILREPPYEH